MDGKEWIVGEQKISMFSKAKCNKKEGDKSKKEKQCDLLEVYNDLDKEKLLDTVGIDWSILNNQDTTKSKDITKEVGFEFTTQRDEEMYKLMDEINANKTVPISIVTETEDWIDDI